jgi:hypothetical protein
MIYKYRSLKDFKNFLDIILYNRLYACEYKKLNDPMEGQYLYPNGLLNDRTRTNLYNEKANLKICSLATRKNNEVMWSHYCDGHKGVVLGVNLIENNATPVNYLGLYNLNNQIVNEQTAQNILLRKLDAWSYEEEQRVFTVNSFVKVEILEINTGRRIPKSDLQLIRKLVSAVNPNINIISANSFM